MNDTDRIKILIRWYYWANFASVTGALVFSIAIVAFAVEQSLWYLFLLALPLSGRFFTDWPRIRAYRTEIERSLMIHAYNELPKRPS